MQQTPSTGMQPRDNARWPFCNLNRFFLLDSVHQWSFMYENQIVEPAMMLSPSMLIGTLLSICYAVSAETLDTTVEDIQRTTLLKAVSAGSSLEILKNGYASFLQGVLQQGRESVRISLSIWVPGELPLENEYSVKVAQNIGAQVFRPRDITSAALKTWAQGQLKKQNVLSDFPSVSPSQVVLLSILRLSAAWERPFEHMEQHTLIEDSQVRNLSIMVQRGTFDYYECEDYKAISIPTQGPLECLFVLPTTSFGNLLKTLAQDYALLFKPMKGSKRLVVKMPVFRVDEGDDICEILEQTLVFRRLLDVSSKCSKLTTARAHIQHIIHKVFVDVNQDGINADGLPARTQSRALQVNENDQVLEFSKDFIFLVRERASCEILLSCVINGANPFGNGRAQALPRPSTPPRLSRQSSSSPSNTSNKAVQPATPRGQAILEASKLVHNLRLRKKGGDILKEIDEARQTELPPARQAPPIKSLTFAGAIRYIDRKQEGSDARRMGENTSMAGGGAKRTAGMDRIADSASAGVSAQVRQTFGQEQSVSLRGMNSKNGLSDAGVVLSNAIADPCSNPTEGKIEKRMSGSRDQDVITLSSDHLRAARQNEPETSLREALHNSASNSATAIFRHLAYSPAFLTTPPENDFSTHTPVSGVIDDERLVALATASAPREWTF